MATIEITTKIGCKVACSYCPQHRIVESYSRRSNIKTMEFETFKKCLKKIPQNYYIVFSGFCEPFHNPNCRKMIQLASSDGYRVSVFTTLAGVQPEDVECLKEISFNTFWVHLPSSDNAERINVDDHYLSVLNRLIKSDIPASFHIHGKEVHPRISLPSGVVANKEGIGARAGNIQVNNHSPLPRRQGKLNCMRQLQQNVLLPNGDVALCCMDYELKSVIGNLLHDSFESLYLSEEYKKIKKGLNNDSLDIICRYCDCAVKEKSCLTLRRLVRRMFKK